MRFVVCGFTSNRKNYGTLKVRHTHIFIRWNQIGEFQSTMSGLGAHFTPSTRMLVRCTWLDRYDTYIYIYIYIHYIYIWSTPPQDLPQAYKHCKYQILGGGGEHISIYIYTYTCRCLHHGSLGDFFVQGLQRCSGFRALSCNGPVGPSAS